MAVRYARINVKRKKDLSFFSDSPLGHSIFNAASSVTIQKRLNDSSPKLVQKAIHIKACSKGNTHLRCMMSSKDEGSVSKLVTVLPGFTHPVSLPIPTKCLPVCIRCKKIYKTRKLCRVRGGHTDLPWSLVYVCVTLDDSCIDPETGRVFDGPFDSVPLYYHQPVSEKDAVPSSLPICVSCKEKNYTREQCREKLEHKQLPWNTVYIKLTRSQMSHSEHPDGRDDNEDANCISPANKRRKTEELDATTAPGITTNEESEPLFPVPTSKTFLIEISACSTILRWLDTDTITTSNESLRPTQYYRAKIEESATFSDCSAGDPPETWRNVNAYNPNYRPRLLPETHAPHPSTTEPRGDMPHLLPGTSAHHPSTTEPRGDMPHLLPGTYVHHPSTTEPRTDMPHLFPGTYAHHPSTTEPQGDMPHLFPGTYVHHPSTTEPRAAELFGKGPNEFVPVHPVGFDVRDSDVLAHAPAIHSLEMHPV